MHPEIARAQLLGVLLLGGCSATPADPGSDGTTGAALPTATSPTPGEDTDVDGPTGSDDPCAPLREIHLPDCATSIRGSGAAAGLGHSVRAIGDANGDGVQDVLVAGDGLAGTLFLFSTDLPSVSTAADAFATVPGWVDYAVGDVTGDPSVDVVVHTTSLLAIDETRIYAGPLSGALEASDAVATVRWATGSTFGAVRGDHDGDGVGDLAITLGNWADGELGAGADDAVLTMRGPFVADRQPEDVEGVLWADDAGSALFTPERGRDLTGDGLDDLVVTDSTSGTAFVVSGPDAFGFAPVRSAATAVLDNGWPLEVAGDVNDDGYIDLGGADGGDATLVFGPFTGNADLAAAAAIRVPDAVHVGSAGDFDGDGIVDLVIGSAPFALLYGPVDEGTLALDGTTRSVTFLRPQPVLWQDWAPLGDVDGDGTPDLVIGSADAASPGAYLLFGRAQGF